MLGDRTGGLAQLKVATFGDCESVARELHDANLLRDSSCLTEARAAYETLLENAPNNPWALNGLGQVLRMLGDCTGALDKFQAAVGADPENISFKLDAANMLRDLSRLPEARTAYEGVLAKVPNNCWALNGLGQVLCLLAEPAAARAQFEAAAAADPDNIGFKLDLANLLRDTSQLSDARAVYELVLEKAPNNALALNGLGQVLCRLGKRVGALAQFQAAAAAEPERIGFKLDYANLLRESGHLAEAESTYRGVLSKAPNNAWALNGLGQVLHIRGDPVGALAQFEAAAAANPDNVNFKLDVANLLREMSHFKDARSVYQGILEHVPDNGWALNGLGQVLRALRDRANALKQFEAAAGADPENLSFKIDVANALRELSRFDEAQAVYELVLGIAPDNAWALNGLAQVLRLLGHWNDALARFQQASAANPDMLSFKLDVVAMLRDAGRSDEAGAILETLSIRAPTDLDLLLHKGILQRRCGDHSSALATFGEAIRLHSSSARALVEAAIEERALGHPEKSRQLLEQALRIAPHELEAMMELAEHCWLEDDVEGALTICRKALEARPDAIWPYLNVSRALTDLGQTTQALAILDQAVGLLGDHPDLIAKRISVLRQAGRWDLAYAAITDARRRYPRQFEIWQHQVEIDLAFGHRETVARALADPPVGSVRQAAQVAFLRGKLFEDHWDLDQAAEQYERAIALDADYVEPYAANARVNLLRLDLDAARRHLQCVMDLTASTLLLRGHLLRPSQSHLGQLINEFALDPELLRELILIHGLGPQERTNALLGVIATHPDSTAAAICLFVALRKGGLLPRSPDINKEHLAPLKIPKRIVQYWNTATRPADITEIMSSWPERNPAFDYIRFDDRTADKFLEENFPTEVVQAYRRSANPAQKADIFRLAYLFVEGGFYVDADDRALAPLLEIAPADACFLAFQEDHGTIANNLLGSIPRHPVIGRALMLATESIRRGDRDMVWLMTGPGLLTRAAAQILSEQVTEISSTLSEFFVLGGTQLRRAVAPHCSAEYKRTGVHWLRQEFVRRATR